MNKKFFKILNKIFYGLLIFILIIYLLVILILYHVGPLTTKVIKQKLKIHPLDIVVSLTTTPYRIDQIKPVLESIKKQSIGPNRIYLNIPWKFKRENTKYIIPNWLQADPNIIINRTEDYGPATKLLATLKKELNPNTIIITIDDDIIYPQHLIRNLIEPYLLDSYKTTYTSGVVFTGAGETLLFNNNYDLDIKSITMDGTPSSIVVGACGVAYQRSLFKDDIFSLLQDMPLSCFLSDDLMLSGYLLANNIEIITTSGAIYNPFSMRLIKKLPSFFTNDALSKGANGISPHNGNNGNYYHCLKFLATNNHTAKFQQVILARNKEILETSSTNNPNNNLIIASNNLIYYCLERLVNILPFMKQIILAVIA